MTSLSPAFNLVPGGLRAFFFYLSSKYNPRWTVRLTQRRVVSMSE